MVPLWHAGRAAGVHHSLDAPAAFGHSPLLCKLASTIAEESKVTILHWQSKCEDAILSLLAKGPLRSVTHLASLAMARIVEKGDNISIYSRVSSLQGWWAESKRSETMSCIGEGMRPRWRWPSPGIARFRWRPKVGGQDKCGGWPQSNADPNTMISTGRREPSNIQPRSAEQKSSSRYGKVRPLWESGVKKSTWALETEPPISSQQHPVLLGA